MKIGCKLKNERAANDKHCWHLAEDHKFCCHCTKREIAMYQSALTADEQSERLYIQQCGENGASTVVDVLLDQQFGHLDAVTRDLLRNDLIGVLTRDLAALQVAVAASLAVGGPDYETWLEGQ